MVQCIIFINTLYADVLQLFSDPSSYTIQSFVLLRCFKNIRGSLNKFPDFFRMGTFIYSTHMKL